MSDRNVALVTGSGRRLGRQIALALARAGFDIVINYNRSRDEAKEAVRWIRELGRDVISVKADITRSSQVKRMVERAIEKFGHIDVLVNNAAIFPKPKKFWEITDEMWDYVLNTNLKGQFLCSREVVKFMLRRKRGRIINIASLGGVQVWTEHIAYNVAKAGLIMLTRAMARALAPHITVNAIAPGTIIIPGEETGEIEHIPEHLIPLKRYGEPSDIADLVVFLATKGDYITGQVILVDGGRSIL
jgi:3-oxoacyl-[acyl-carrier protein] reductase